MAARAFCVVVLFVALQVSTTLACNGYELIISKIEKCENTKYVIEIENFNLTLSDDCHVIPTGTVTYGDIKTAKTALDVTFLNRHIKQTIDICHIFSILPETITKHLKSRNIETTCPFKGRSVSAKGFDVNIDVYKNFLNFGVGRTHGKVTTTFDSGMSCYIFDSELKLKPGARRAKPKLKDLKKLRNTLKSFGLKKVL